MDDYEVEVQALLHDIDGNYGEGPARSSLPYLRPVYPLGSVSSSIEVSRPQPIRAYQQNQLIDPRASEPIEQDFQGQHHGLFTSYNEHDQHSATLEHYDRSSHPRSGVGHEDYIGQAVLEEPRHRMEWTDDGRSGTIAPGRLSLPSHTAPRTPTPANKSVPIHPNRRRPEILSDFRTKISQFVHTPSNKDVESSSPVLGQASSPLFVRSENRSIQGSLDLPKFDVSSRHAAVQSYTNPNAQRTRSGAISRTDPDDAANSEASARLHSSAFPYSRQANLSHAPPVVQGIPLISTNNLPDRFRSIFSFNPFNAIQSKCYSTAYQSSDNLVVSAPTGGGKTAIFEMAICRLMSGFNNDQYKIVYMGPTKSLCSERQRDWQAKFVALDLKCAELTGDTEYAHLRSVQSAQVVITTPEKWDSMTRQWKDHAKLMQLVKLVLIDEVHMLRDSRGATLEAVVSRMKSIGSDVRFIALSATVPNSEDVATWLGRNHINKQVPAVREVFGESFRPVKLQKHIIGLPYRGNDYGFEGICDPKLPGIINSYSHKKPVMIFCITRKAAVSTAKLLANVWANKHPRDRQWQAPAQQMSATDPELTNTLSSAVAFHHAGLDGSDRHIVEQGFLSGQIKVICCTSTLAVGINLPCHLVIIKNTVGYQAEGLKEYSDLEITQMLGRAGRPQFDDSAAAVIITKQEKVKKYEQLVAGGQLLESSLHLNLIDHLNAEIGLSTVHDLQSAKRWLAGTFLYVRLRQNPDYYKLDEDRTSSPPDERIEKICEKELRRLAKTNLIKIHGEKINAAELGKIMAKYYIKFDTMGRFLSLGSRPRMSDILSTIVQAEEYHEIRLKGNEKKLFKVINNSIGIKFPIKVDLASDAHKRSLLIQSELGGVEFPMDEQYVKLRRQFQQDRRIIFAHVNRLIRCVIDIQVHILDAVGTRHALEFSRSFSAEVWDNSPFQMKQIPQLGPVAVRKLAMGGVNNIETLEAAEPHRLELLLSKNAPFGSRLLANVKEFPKLRVSIKMMGKNSTKGSPVTVKLKLECGFMNDKPPLFFHKRPIYVCLLVERSDGHLADFRRISAKTLDRGQEILLTAELTCHTQHITCYVMCDEIAGTMRYAELKPGLPASVFPPAPTEMQQTLEQNTEFVHAVSSADDEFDADNIDDQDLVDIVEGRNFTDIEKFGADGTSKASKDLQQEGVGSGYLQWIPERLNNGNWACNHNCKDKTACRHMCCRDGLQKPPKAPKNSFVPASLMVDASSLRQTDSTVVLTRDTSCTKVARCGVKGAIENVNLANDDEDFSKMKTIPQHIRKLERLHQDTTKGARTPAVSQRSSHDFSKDSQPIFSFLHNSHALGPHQNTSIDYGDEWVEDLPSWSDLLEKPHDGKKDENMNALNKNMAASNSNEQVHDIDSLENFDLSQFDEDRLEMDAAIVGLSDSTAMQDDSLHPTEEANVGFPCPTMATTHLSTPELPGLSATMSMDNKAPKPFLSTDSPEKTLPTIENRKCYTGGREADENFFFDTIPAPKRHKKSIENEVENSILQPSSRAISPSPAPVPLIKPGQPAWVYEFDPTFIAEYQDIVDFV